VQQGVEELVVLLPSASRTAAAAAAARAEHGAAGSVLGQELAGAALLLRANGSRVTSCECLFHLAGESARARQHLRLEFAGGWVAALSWRDAGVREASWDA